jgi:hypothetical protein
VNAPVARRGGAGVVGQVGVVGQASACRPASAGLSGESCGASAPLRSWGSCYWPRGATGRVIFEGTVGTNDTNE